MKRTRSMAILISLAFFAASAPALAAHHEADEAKAKGQQKAKEMKEKANDAKGEAMRERRDERKAIMEEVKSTTEPSERKGKKPWWKFWGSDDEE